MTGIPPDDRGFTLGDGLFETLLVEDGVIAYWDDHLARLSAGCAALGLPAPDPAALRTAADMALAGQDGRFALRLTVTAGGGGRGLDRPPAPVLRIAATAASAPKPLGPVALAIVEVRRNDRSPTSRLKTLAYLDNVLAREAARAGGAGEAVMLNTRDEVACAAAGNLFWITDGRLFTPSIECGVLAGLTRRRTLAAAMRLGVSAVEVRADLSVLRAAEAVFVSNSLIGLRAAASLDGRDLSPHPIIERLAAAL